MCLQPNNKPFFHVQSHLFRFVLKTETLSLFCLLTSVCLSVHMHVCIYVCRQLLLGFSPRIFLKLCILLWSYFWKNVAELNFWKKFPITQNNILTTIFTIHLSPGFQYFVRRHSTTISSFCEYTFPKFSKALW